MNEQLLKAERISEILLASKLLDLIGLKEKTSFPSRGSLYGKKAKISRHESTDGNFVKSSNWGQFEQFWFRKCPAGETPLWIWSVLTYKTRCSRVMFS